MGPLTETLPKPMLQLAGKNLIEHKIAALPAEVTEVILVIGYLGEKIQEFFGDEYRGRKIKYVTQHTLDGTGKALWRAKELLKGKFIVMMGDDIYHPEDIANCLKHDWAVLVKKSETEKSTGGRVLLNSEGIITNIVEGTHNEKGALICTALYVLTPDIFKYELIKIPNREEWGLPQTIVTALNDFPIKVVESKFWLQLSNPNDLAQAEKTLETVANIVKI